ncbi:uncharacterized protein PAE49_020978 [Odontesthes bonariensis]
MRRLFTSVSSHREKMICRILLLIILTSCVCAATFVVNVPQSSYQAEEKHSITLEWTFTTKPDSSWSSLFICCDLITDDKILLLYHVYDGAEVSQSQDKWFAGRVQSDKDALSEGRLRLNVSRLRTEDSGLCVCIVKIDYDSGSGICRLNVTAAESPQPDSSGGIGLHAAPGLTAVVTVALLIILVLSR